MQRDFKEIVEPLMIWFQKEKRDLPWRHTTDSYKIWISEIMLQQTRVEAVINYYNRFIEALPTIKALAEIEEDKLLKLWEGLGYYSRARNLKKCAETVIEQNLDQLPNDYELLKALPGIGDYTAGSIGSIAYQLKTPAIDGNVLRVLTRLEENPEDIMNPKVRKDYFNRLQKIMPDNTRDFTESLMELGALVCLPNGMPLCDKCPLSSSCLAYKNQSIELYPQKKKSKERKIEEKTILIFQYQNSYAIRKRREKGLLESMYEFPNMLEKKDEDQLKQYLKEHHFSYETIEKLKDAKHIFSHIEWHMNGYLITLNKKPNTDWLWVTSTELKKQYSIPNAFSKYLNCIIS